MKIGFLGAGNMAKTLGTRIACAKGHDLYFYSPSGESAKNLADHLKGKWVEALTDFPTDLDFLFFAFKPQMLKSVALPNVSSKTVFVSLLAAIDLSVLQSTFNSSRLIRLMPNTPSEIGLGVLPFLFHPSINRDEDLKNSFKLLSQSFGELIEASDDEEFEGMTPYTGCMPGVFFYMLETMAKDLQAHGFLAGLSLRDKEKLMIKVIKGCVDLADESTEDLLTLTTKVTSKGGLTEKAILSMKESSFDQIFKSSMGAALKRSVEIRALMKENN